MSYRLPAIAAAAAALALQGCANKPPPAPAAGEDLNLGIAKTCTFTPAQPTPGGTVNSTITMTNDGWCAVRVKEADGHPYLLGLVRARPEHGHLLVQKLGGETRLEYHPQAPYTGADRFTVALRSNTASTADATVQVAVNVSMGVGMAPPRPAPAAEKPAPTRRAPARRTTRTTTH